MSDFSISRIHHASFIVADVKRALDFYQSVLGLTIDPNRHDPGYPGAWLNIRDQQIHLLELPNPDPLIQRLVHAGRDRHLALNVTDINALQKKLEEYAIPYTLSKSGRRAVFCRDPDGNALEFIELNAV